VQIFLIRHPQPAVASSICYGQSDINLANDSLLHLKALAQSLRKQLPDNFLLYSSPLLRCRALADTLHTQAIYDNRLKEMYFGEWEMCLWSNIPRQQLNYWAADPLHYVIPSGESVMQMQERVLAFIKDMQEQKIGNLVLVTHAGVMKILFAQAKKLPINEWMNQHFDYGSLHQIELNL